MRLPFFLLFLRIWLLDCRSSQQIVHADAVEIRQLDQNLHRVVQNTDLVLGICVLLDVQILCNLLLRISAVNAQIADRLKFQNLIAHDNHPL